MPPRFPSPSKTVRSASGSVARLLGSTRLGTASDATESEMLAPPAVALPPRATRVGKYDSALVSLVGLRPGVTVAQAAEELDVHPTALYPVIRRLEARGQLIKRGRELQPTPIVDEQRTKSAVMERLWCEEGHWWQRPRTRGPKPKRCSDHR